MGGQLDSVLLRPAWRLQGSPQFPTLKPGRRLPATAKRLGKQQEDFAKVADQAEGAHVLRNADLVRLKELNPTAPMDPFQGAWVLVSSFFLSLTMDLMMLLDNVNSNEFVMWWRHVLMGPQRSTGMYAYDFFLPQAIANRDLLYGRGRSLAQQEVA